MPSTSSPFSPTILTLSVSVPGVPAQKLTSRLLFVRPVTSIPSCAAWAGGAIIATAATADPATNAIRVLLTMLVLPPARSPRWRRLAVIRGGGSTGLVARRCAVAGSAAVLGQACPVED